MSTVATDPLGPPLPPPVNTPVVAATYPLPKPSANIAAATIATEGLNPLGIFGISNRFLGAPAAGASAPPPPPLLSSLGAMAALPEK